MSPMFRERILLPVAVLMGSLVLVEVLAFSLSRVFLAVSHRDAALAALGVALAILLLCALVVSRPRLSSSTLAALCVVGFLAVVGAGVALMGQAPEGGHGPAAEQTADDAGH